MRVVSIFVYSIADWCSLLLHAILSNTNYGPQGEKGLKREDYENIGSASFAQLAELRHRGAFSTVSQTFATCCQRCAQSKDQSISSLPNAWYQVRKFHGNRRKGS